MFETFESRRLLSGTALVHSGTQGADSIVVQQTSINVDGSVNLTINGVEKQNVSSLTVKGLGGNDGITLNDVTIPTTVLAGAGDDVITANNTADSVSKFLSGDEGQDLITSFHGGDQLMGGEGKDSLTVYNSDAAQLIGENGVDNFFVFSSKNTIVDGGSGKDSLTTDEDSFLSMLSTGRTISVETIIFI